MTNKLAKASAAMLLLLLSVFSTFAQGTKLVANWADRSEIPGDTGRLSSFSFVIDDQIYVGGGAYHKDFWMYNPGTDTWTQKADVPGVAQSRSFGVGFAIGGKGYVGIGLADYPVFTEKADLWEYNPSTDVWTEKAPMPGSTKSGVGCFVLGNKAYMISGSDSVGACDEVYRYDVGTDSWAQMAQFPGGKLYNPIAFSVNNAGYITCGGLHVNDTTFVAQTATWMYEPATDSWVQKASFNGQARDGGIAFTMGGKAFVGLGAADGYASYFRDIYVYDPIDDSWQATAMELPDSKRAFAIAQVVNDTAYIGGGWSFDDGSVTAKQDGPSEHYYSDWHQMTVSEVAGISSAANDAVPIQCYPNPTSGVVTIGKQAVGQPYQVVDVTGRVLMQGVVAGNGRVDIGVLAGGQYVIMTAGKSGQRYRGVVSRL